MSTNSNEHDWMGDFNKDLGTDAPAVSDVSDRRKSGLMLDSFERDFGHVQTLSNEGNPRDRKSITDSVSDVDKAKYEPHKMMVKFSDSYKMKPS